MSYKPENSVIGTVTQSAPPAAANTELAAFDEFMRSDVVDVYLSVPLDAPLMRELLHIAFLAGVRFGGTKAEGQR